MYFSLGIVGSKKEIHILCIEKDYNKIVEETKKEIKDTDISEYRIFNMTRISQLNELKDWIISFGETPKEATTISQNIVKELLKIVRGEK